MKPLILLTNDDGIDSPGLLAMAEAAEEFGELLIAAPALQQTSMGRSFPRTEKLGITFVCKWERTTWIRNIRIPCICGRLRGAGVS